MNLYQYSQGRPTTMVDPKGRCSEGPLDDALDVFLQHLKGAPGLPFVFPLHSNNPHQHCVWNCRMTRVMGPAFAVKQSWNKELIDNAFADLRDSLQEDCCWDNMPSWLRDYIQDYADSAFQLSDFYDNAMGIVQGTGINDPFPWDDTKCEDACTSAGVGPNTPEGPNTPRPFGPRSQR